MDLIFLKHWLTRNIPTIHSIIWNNPRPGHSPRFDPKKLRESMKLNLSTEVFFTLTSSLNIKLNIDSPSHSVIVPSSTVATVLTQGRRQSEIFNPENMSTKTGLIVLDVEKFYTKIPKWSNVLSYKSYSKSKVLVASLMLSTVQKGFKPGGRNDLTNWSSQSAKSCELWRWSMLRVRPAQG